MTSHNDTWSPFERTLLIESFRAGGIELCMQRFPHKTDRQIRQKINRMGWTIRGNTLIDRFVTLDMPERYQAEWEPLKPVERLPLREGAEDALKLPSYVP